MLIVILGLLIAAGVAGWTQRDTLPRLWLAVPGYGERRMLMQEAEWLAATEEIRRVFGGRMSASESFALVDVLLPVGRTGVEVLLGVDESHIASEQRDAIYTLQDAMTSRSDGTYQVVGVFVSAEPVPSPALARALGRMAPVDGIDGAVVPLTLEQAHQIAAQESDTFDLLEPMFELAGVAASRPEADRNNAAGELLAEIAVLLDRYGAG